MPFGSRYQKATLWTQNGLGADGFPAFNAPVPVTVRWEERLVLINSENNIETLSSNARVWLGQDVAEGDFLYLGTSADASPPSSARKVIRFVKIPAVRAGRFERVAYLD